MPWKWRTKTVFLVGLSEPERAASGIGQLKTVYRSTMSSVREGNLNLIQLQRITDIDVDAVAHILIAKNPRRMFCKSILFV